MNEQNKASRETQDAADALNAFAKGPAKDAANLTAQAFEAAGQRIAKSLEQAAARGTFSLSALAGSLASDLARLAVSELISGPLDSLLGGGGQTQSGGGKAPAAPFAITMNINGVSDPAGFQKTQGQIAAGLARAVAHGQRLI